MRSQSIGVMSLLLAGSAALFVLQQKNASTEITPRPLLYLVADTQRELERIPLVLTRVSVKEENTIGQELARQFHSATSESDPKAQRMAAYLNEVGGRLVAHTRRKGIAYRFHYVPDSNLVNAMALPGGQVFVGRGMMDLCETEDELAAVLGHEIAHVDQRHAIERLQYELQSGKLGLGGFYRLGSLGVMLFRAGYIKEQELEADRVGLRLSVAAGYSPAGGLGVMRKFSQLRLKVMAQPDSPVQEVVSVPLQSLREYFRSHPPPHERLAVLEKQIAARGWDSTQPQRPIATADPTGETALP